MCFQGGETEAKLVKFSGDNRLAGDANAEHFYRQLILKVNSETDSQSDGGKTNTRTDDSS